LSATDAKEKIAENRQALDDARMALAGASDDLRKARDQQEVKTRLSMLILFNLAHKQRTPGRRGW
jgi:hypothetical protein